MAILSDSDRNDASKQLILQAFVKMNQIANLDTSEVRTLINDLDAFLESNAATVNNAITASVRNKATVSMKALAVAWVALKRAGAI